MLVGTLMAIQVMLTAVRVTRMSAWPTVPATLEQVELHRPGSATSRSLPVAARYRYEVDGRSFTGTRVSICQPDSVGLFFQHTYDDLHGRLERKESVPAHVNPADPSEAVLLPVWRPELVAFQLAVVGLAWGAGAWAFRRRHVPAAPSADEDDSHTARTAKAMVWGIGLLGVGCIGLGLVLTRRDPATDT